MNLEEWYQWLAAFTGLLCKKHGWAGAGGRGRGRGRQRCGNAAAAAATALSVPCSASYGFGGCLQASGHVAGVWVLVYIGRECCSGVLTAHALRLCDMRAPRCCALSGAGRWRCCSEGPGTEGGGTEVARQWLCCPTMWIVIASFYENWLNVGESREQRCTRKFYVAKVVWCR